VLGWVWCLWQIVVPQPGYNRTQSTGTIWSSSLLGKIAAPNIAGRLLWCHWQIMCARFGLLATHLILSVHTWTSNPSVTGGEVELSGSFRRGAAACEAWLRLTAFAILPLPCLLELCPAFIYLMCAWRALTRTTPRPSCCGPAQHEGLG